MKNNKLFLLFVVLILSLSLVACSNQPKLSAKDSFVAFFKSFEVKDKVKTSTKKIEEFIKAGEFDFNVKAENTKDDSESLELDLEGAYDVPQNKYLLKIKDTTLLLDMSTEKLYLSKDGEVFSTPIPEEIQEQISEFMDALSNEEKSSEKDYTDKIINLLYSSLNEEWFKIAKNKDGMKEYVLTMDGERIKEFFKNFLSGIQKDKELMEVLNTNSEEEIDFEELIDELDDLKIDAKFEMKFIAKKADIKKLSGMSFELESDEFNLKLDLHGEKKKELASSKELNLVGSVEADGLKISLNGVANKKELRLECSASEERMVSTQTEKMLFEIKSDDNKEFLNSNSISLRMKVTEQVDDEEEKVQEELRITLKSEDKKELIKSSLIKLEMENADQYLLLKANDEKGISESSDISLLVSDGSEELEVINLKATDNKGIRNSSSLELNIESEDMTIKLEALDNKTFDKTKNVRLSYVDKSTNVVLETSDKKLNADITFIDKGMPDYDLDEDGRLVVVEPDPMKYTIKGTLTIKDKYSFDKVIDIKNAEEISEYEFSNKLSEALPN